MIARPSRLEIADGRSGGRLHTRATLRPRVLVAASFTLASSLAADFAGAQEPAPGLMQQSAATSGSAEITTTTFDAAKKLEEAKDATEAKIQAGGLQASGNSRSLALTGVSSLRVRRSANEVSAAAAANFGKSAPAANAPMETNVENYQAKLRYDRFLSQVLSAFLSVSARNDRFQGLDLRLNLDPGLAYYFIDEAKHQLSAELGYDLQYDVVRRANINAALVDGIVLERTKTRHSGRAFTGYRNNLNEAVSLTTGLEYLQGLQETKYWRLNWDAGVSAQVATRFSLATTFSVRYDHAPLPNVKTTDTLTAVNLVYTLL
jgi:putative salt-induced outer membrane protein